MTRYIVISAYELSLKIFFPEDCFKPEPNNLKENIKNFFKIYSDQVTKTGSPDDIVTPQNIKDAKIPPPNEECNGVFCYWFPELFGIDEDVIPSSDEEGVFEELTNNKELEKRANDLTSLELKTLKVDSKANFSNTELRRQWKLEQIPKYGRRARPKPILVRENGERFECLCDIDRSFCRHYISHFGGGVAAEGEELRTPHFAAFWENFKEKTSQLSATTEWAKVFEAKLEEERTSTEKEAAMRSMPKFSGSSQRDIKIFREKLAAHLRPLDCREIRRFRMPFAEALYLELQEDRYFDSASFFRNLIIKDYIASKSADYKPSLMHNKGRMKFLVEFLKLAEKFSKRKEYHKESVILLKSGKYFNDHSEIWWWIAEEFYKKAVKVSQKSVIDGGKSEAIARYIFGTFLLECVDKAQLAQEHLSKAIELSQGKDWSAEGVLEKKQKPVYKECSSYLCQALIASSKELRRNGKPDEALRLIHRSYKICLEAHTFRQDVEMETYFELGMTYQAIGMLDWAKMAFKKFVELAKMQNLPRSLCDGYLELAITYRSEGDLVRCHHCLVNYLEVAEANKDESLIAFGNRYLGEFHLNNGDPKVASQFFEEAFNSYYKQCTECAKIPLNLWIPEHFSLLHDLELSRVLVGLAKGEEVTKSICRLIIQARDARDKDKILNLLDWKNKRQSILEVDEKRIGEATESYSDSLTEIINPSTKDMGKIHGTASEAFNKSVRFASTKTGSDETVK